MTLSPRLMLSRCPLAITSLLLAGCATEVSDTEERVFAFECVQKECKLRLLGDDEKPIAQEATHALHKSGRLLLVCDSEKEDFSCRPLRCDSSSPCSQLGGSEFSCNRKLCQAPGHELNGPDRLALCLAETGAWKPTREQLVRLTDARACLPPACDLPSSCLQP